MAKEDRVIEVHSASEILTHFEMQRKIFLRNEKMLRENASMLEQAMVRSAPYDRNVAKAKAKRVVRHYLAAADSAHEQAVLMVRTAKEFNGQYTELIEPTRKRNKHQIDWKN